MADAPVTAPAAGTPSTPTTAAAPSASAPAPAAPAATSPAPSQPATQGVTTAETPVATTESPQADPTAPLFTLPADMNLAPESVTAFESAIKPKLLDGKVSLSPQEVVDLFASQARDANTRWQKSLDTLNTTNEAECKSRFTPAQLAASERAIGFLSSFEPQFRELAKIQLNSPIFVNAMRIVGERLSEDNFERAGNPSPARPKTRAEKAQFFYGKKTG
jgi:hypothetical protein